MQETTERKQTPQEAAAELAKMARAGADVSGAVEAASVSPVAAARMLPCALCWAAADTPCQQSPEGDHLARYLDAYADGRISRPDMAAVFAAAEVITTYRIVPAAVTS